MACIIFFMDKEESHILSSFGLGHALKEAGHTITYVNIPENENLIVEQGFTCFVLAEEKDLIFYLTEGQLDPLFEEKRPDLIIVSSYLLLESLILHYKYAVFPVILTDYLRNPSMSLVDNLLFVVTTMPGDVLFAVVDFIQSLGITFHSLDELANALAGFHELVLCPRELEIAQQPQNGRTYHIGPFIRPGNDTKTSPELNKIKKGKRIIYASLGGPAESYEGPFCLRFYQRLVHAMGQPDLADSYMIMSVRHDFDIKTIGLQPENVCIMNHIPDIAVIKNASLVISHGELVVIKESIYHGVPVMLLPLMDIQYRHAVLIEYHALGISEKIDIITEERLRSSILYLLHNETIQANVESMKKIFHEREESQDGAVIINELFRSGAGNAPAALFLLNHEQ